MNQSHEMDQLGENEENLQCNMNNNRIQLNSMKFNGN